MRAERDHGAERERVQERRRPALRQEAERSDGLLALQRSAGNRALAAQLQIARDEAVPADTGAPGRTLTLARLSHPLEVLSFSLGGHPTAQGGGGDAHNMHVTVMLDDTGPELSKAAADGRSLGDGELVAGGSRFVLTDVLVTSVVLRDQTVALTLNFASIEAKTASE